MKKRVISMILCVMLALSVASAAFADGDSMFDAINVVFGTEYSGNIQEETGKYFYKIELTQPGMLTLNVQANIKNVQIWLYDSDMTSTITWADPGWNSVTQLINYEYSQNLNAGTYYVVIGRDYSNFGPFKFKASFASSEETFPESGEGNDNEIGSANALELGTTCNGFMGWNEKTDFYKFTMPSSGLLTLNASAKLRYVNYYINDKDGVQVWHSNLGWNSVTETIVSEFKFWLDKGDYYFVVGKDGSNTGAYSFTTKFDAIQESFPEMKDDYNDTAADADTIALNLTYSGTIAYSSKSDADSDYYKFTLFVPDEVTIVSTTEDMTRVTYSLSDAEGKVLLNETPSANSTTKRLLFRSNGVKLDPGTYYLQVKRYYDNYGKYEVSVKAASGFTDVEMEAYYIPAVSWALNKGITTGTGTGITFAPLTNVTRAEAVTFLWRLAGEPAPRSTANPFTDVKSSAWYYDAVLWANEKNITNGTTDTTFSPDKAVTRGEMVVFLWRADGKKGNTNDPVWYADAERWATEQGILIGTAVPYTNKGVCPRSDVVFYMYNANQK